MKLPIPMPVSRAITKLGRDLSLARRRRRMSQASFAERMGTSLATLKRLENGDPRVAVETVARALHVLGEINRIDNLLDTSEDAIGLVLMDEQLPKSVRARKSSVGL
jgi:transcriptional regulator with XRE-family HTH domain